MRASIAFAVLLIAGNILADNLVITDFTKTYELGSTTTVPLGTLEATTLDGSVAVTFAASKGTPVKVVPDLLGKLTIIPYGVEGGVTEDICKEANLCSISTDDANGKYIGTDYLAKKGKTVIPLVNGNFAATDAAKTNQLAVSFYTGSFPVKTEGVIGLSPKSDFITWALTTYTIKDHPKEFQIAYIVNNNAAISGNQIGDSKVVLPGNKLYLGWVGNFTATQTFSNAPAAENTDRWGLAGVSMTIPDTTAAAPKVVMSATNGCFAPSYANNFITFRNQADYVTLIKALSMAICKEEECKGDKAVLAATPIITINIAAPAAVKTTESRLLGAVNDTPAPLTLTLNVTEYVRVSGDADKKSLVFAFDFAPENSFPAECDNGDTFMFGKYFFTKSNIVFGRKDTAATISFGKIAGADTPAADPSKPWYKTWWFWTLVAVGVVVLIGIGAGVFFLMKSGESD